jgi:metallo-beta-lactamase family protein
MRITPHGAAGGDVTGSAYLLETGQAKVLVDCGLFQGTPRAEERNRLSALASFRKLHAVLLTHAHLDHTGRLPLLTKLDYSGPIYCTPATADMANLILHDAAKIQIGDIERVNRRRQRQGKEPLEPLYTPADIEELMPLFRTVPYHQPVPVAPGIEARWTEAGHMLGSASIQLTAEDKGRRKTIVFSGDIGQRDAPLLNDAEPFTKADAVFLESTYGDRDHRPFKETVEECIAILNDAVNEGGKILVPTFAVGRAQVLTALLAWMFRRKRIKLFPVIIDSPMAIEATKIYAKHPELWDEELKNFVAEHDLMADLKMPGARVSVTADDSKKLNEMPGPCLIMAGAGMCNAGRILHHLRANLWRPETHVLIVGYQGHGTLGRSLVDGAKEVKIFGEPIKVVANVHTLGGFSAHAGQSDLLRWFSSMAHCKPRVFLTHGEDRGRKPLGALIRQRFKIAAQLPGHKETLEI